MPSFSYSSYQFGLHVQEEKLDVQHTANQLSIGIPKETEKEEKRIPLTPECAEMLVGEGYKVILESGAGLFSNFSDMEYCDCGVTIASSPEEVFKSDIILKIRHPRANETAMMKDGSLVISTLYNGKPTIDSIKALMNRKITAIAAERIADHAGYPVRNTLFPIEGKAVMLLAAELLTNTSGKQGILLGGVAGISPVEVVILGAGIAAEHAAQVAIALGATVKIFSNSLDDLSDLKQKIGQSLFTSFKHQHAIYKACSTADVIISTHDFSDLQESFVITEDLMAAAKKGAVILDMSIHNESCFPTGCCENPNDYLLNKYGIIYHCVTNISSRVAHTTSTALSNMYVPILLKIAQYHNITSFLHDNKGFLNSVYVFNGMLTDTALGRKYNIPHQDINLLLAAF